MLRWRDQRQIAQRSLVGAATQCKSGGNFPDGRQNVRITAPLRMSGDLSGTPGIRLISPFAELEITSGVIVAQRHIHMSPLDALIYGVTHGDKVAVAIEGDERRLIFENVAVRVSPDMRLEMHIDTDEANAAGADSPDVFATLVSVP